ncbi:MAG: alpha/beta hydrolase [Planctomycetota bacterium]|jgi:predicted esterase
MKQSHSGSSRLSVYSRKPSPPAIPHTWDDAALFASQLPESRTFSVGNGAVGIVPSNYEPRYAYPLIVWLTDSRCPVDTALEYVSGLSPQNYVGLAIDDCIIQSILSKGSTDLDTPVEFLRRVADTENRIVRLIREFGRSVSFHAERIFIAGVGDAATTALLIAMHQPDWFGGCIAIDGEFPPAGQLLARNVELVERRFLLSSRGGRSAFQSVNATRHIARQLIASGANVTARIESGDEPVSTSTLRSIDNWILAGILKKGA